MKLFVGLGNPGQKYEGNRHNVGFMALDSIADRNDLGPWRKRFHGLTCDGTLGSERVLLIKPQGFYNESGNPVREAAKFLKIKAADIIVFHDEIDLAPSKLRVKFGGGLAGNNGLRSINAQMGGPDFWRVRIGVGHPGDKNQVANYVLRDFAKADRAWLDTVLDAIARSAGKLADGEADRFQSDVAQAVAELREQENENSRPTEGQSSAPAPQSRSSAAPPVRSAKAGTGAGSKTSTRKSSAPSQMQLARQGSSNKRKKTSRKIKKGVTGDRGVTLAGGEQNEQTAAAAPETDGKTALADRLKRWLSGNKDE
ncbi:MAG: aminoacyl-tRNA hydrolase [Pseudomonadota bacterium]